MRDILHNCIIRINIATANLPISAQSRRSAAESPTLSLEDQFGRLTVNKGLYIKPPILEHIVN